MTDIQAIRKAAEAALQAGQPSYTHADYVDAVMRLVKDDPATVLELCRLAEIAEFLLDSAEHISGWNGPEPSPAEFHISWGTQQHSPDWNPLTDLGAAVSQWREEKAEMQREYADDGVTWEPPK